MLSFLWPVVMLAAGRFATPADALPTAQDVRGLTSAQAAERRSVRLTGVVTYANPHAGDFFVQDATAGVYVRSGAVDAVKHGDLVTVEGTTDGGEFAPCVVPRAVRVVGKGRLPDPIPFTLSWPESRWLDAQWVYSWVTIRGASVSGKFTEVRVHSTGGLATLRIPDAAAAAVFRTLIDRSIPIRGVCLPQSRDRVVTGPPTILVQSLPLLPVFPSSAPKSYTTPRAIRELFQNFTPQSGQRQVKIVGVVTASPYAGLAFVHDETGGAAVRLPPRESVPLHSRVEVEGWLQIDGRRVGLARSRVKVLGPATPAVPVNVTADALADDERNAELVRIEGRVESAHAVAGWTELTLTDRAHRFAVFVPGGSFPIGAKVSAVGVVTIHHPDGKSRSTPAVLARTAADVTVVESPAPPPPPTTWTTARVTGLLSVLGVAVAVAGAWVFSLRGQVRRATAQVRKQFDDRAELEAQLKHAAKLEAVGRLAGGIAHDFNNLLTVINGCAELLGSYPSDRSNAAALLGDIKKAGQKAAELTGQLLMFSRKKDVVLVGVNLNEATAEAAQLVHRVIGEDIRVETKLAADLPPVLAEPGLLHQVVMNLAVNARDAMPDGGTLTIETEIPEDDADPQQWVRLKVSDTGCGMDDKTQARLFEPFFTTKEIGKGTGLGLATVYGIVKALGGRVQVASAVGKGSAFHIDLRPFDAAPISTIRAAATEVRLDGLTVLLVEDSDMVRDTLALGLRETGAAVVSASGGEAALRLLDADDGRIAVMVTDVVMPGMSGRELAERVRSRRPTLPVLFMSGYTSDEVVRRGVLEDRMMVVQKPMTADQLAAKIVRVVGLDSARIVKA